MPKKLLSFLLTTLVCLLVIFAQPFPKPEVKVWVFDIGQGDAVFIDAPHQQILIDGGPDELLLERLASVMPWWDRSIDIVVNTHPHADHYLGLIPVLERYHVSQIFDANQGSSDPAFATYLSTAQGRRELLVSDVTIDLGAGVRLQTIWPSQSYHDQVLDDPNDGSVVFLLEYGETSMLLTGDAGVEEEAKWNVGDVDILKVGHHGSDTSTSQALLDRITPEVAIISVGKDNDYGHPSSFVLDRLRQLAIDTYRTDLDGSILVRINRLAYSVKTKSF